MMVRRYLFVALVLSTLLAAGWWSRSLQSLPDTRPSNLSENSVSGGVGQPAPSTERRRELLELLDRVVAYEHYYRSVYGHFTQILSRVGVSVPSGLAEVYDVRVAEASSDLLRVTAVSEIDGRIMDMVSVDQAYGVRANFTLPPPRPDYLRARALRHLRRLRETSPGQTPDEATVFRGYFRFEVRDDTRGSRVAFAVGTRPPVVGLQIEYTGSGEGFGADFPEVAAQVVGGEGWGGEWGEELGWSESTVGQKSAPDGPTNNLQDAYLAQKIFRGEFGRYAKSWAELSRIAAFRFEGRDGSPEAVVPFGDTEAVVDLEGGEDLQAPRGPAGRDSDMERGTLVIEPIEGAGH